VYYENSKALTENENVLSKRWISPKTELKRAEYSFEYGQNTKFGHP